MYITVRTDPVDDLMMRLHCSDPGVLKTRTCHYMGVPNSWFAWLSTKQVNETVGYIRHFLT